MDTPNSERRMSESSRSATNEVSARHPHEPEIPPLLDKEGRCYVCRCSVLERQLAEERDYIKRMDAVIDDAGVARSCINPLEDLKLAIAHLKRQIPSAERYAWSPASKKPTSEDYIFIVRDVDGQLAFSLWEDGKWNHVPDADCGDVAEWIAVPPPGTRIASSTGAHDWQPDGGVLKFESHPHGETPHVHTTCSKCGARAWFIEHQWDLLSKGCSGINPSGWDAEISRQIAPELDRIASETRQAAHADVVVRTPSSAKRESIVTCSEETLKEALRPALGKIFDNLDDISMGESLQVLVNALRDLDTHRADRKTNV